MQVSIGIVLILSHDVVARDMTNPLALRRNSGYFGFMHYPIPRPKDQDACWNIDTWGAGYYRFADKVFRDTKGTTVKTDPLDAVFFGAADFTGIQAFAPGSVDPENPFLQFTLLSPRFDYTEKGAFFGFTVERQVSWCGCDWRVGMRASLPYRDIEVELDSCCNLEETLEDVAVLQRERVPDEEGNLQTLDSFAYRLDFLSSLLLAVNSTELLVNYRTSEGHVAMNQRVVDNDNNYPIHVIDIDSGAVPPPPFALVLTSDVGENVADLPALSGNGLGVPNGTRAHFVQANDYTPLGASVAAQRKLWVVPTAFTDESVFDISEAGRNINTAVQNIIEGINTSAVGFFNANGVTFDTQRTVGPGDLDVEFYANSVWCDFFGELFLGARFPTGKRINNPGLLLKLPAGNNGHYEVQAGAMGGWEGLDWLNIKVDGLYSFVLPRTEKVAAPFEGATIKNIGPTIDGKVSWQYFVGDLAFTFLVPCNPRVGLNIGYQVYWKRRDKISFDITSAADFFGVVHPLDASVLEQRTNVVAHKICSELFHQGDNWEVAGGWTHAFAGKNAFKDSEWYLSLLVYF